MSSSYNNECVSGNLDKTVTNVVELLKQNGWTISTAESCTGGLLSELITSVAGASEVFELGILNGFLYERLEIKAVLSLFDVAELRSYLGVTGGEYRAAVLIRER